MPAVSGLLPIPEIQYLAYLHNAEDQLRGEAASLQFFSNGQYRNPMVVRVAGLAYQKGFGGHFHNDNAVGVLRDIPGLVVAVPARGDDAAAMLRTCLAAADSRRHGLRLPRADRALPHARPARARRRRLAVAVPRPRAWADAHVPIGRGRTYGDGRDLTLVTFGNGVPMSLRVARRLAETGIGARVLDLRWLAPLPGRGPAARGAATGPGAGGRRDPALGRRLGRRRDRAGRRRLQRPDRRGSPPRTASSRSATPPTTCWSPRPASRRQRRTCWHDGTGATACPGKNASLHPAA